MIASAILAAFAVWFFRAEARETREARAFHEAHGDEFSAPFGRR